MYNTVILSFSLSVLPVGKTYTSGFHLWPFTFCGSPVQGEDTRI